MSGGSLGHGLEALELQARDRLAVAVCAGPDDDRLVGGLREPTQQVIDCVMIGHIGRPDSRLIDQLRVRIHRHVGAVAVEAPVMGLAAVAGLRVHGGDHPIGCHPFGDPEDPVLSFLDVLAGQIGHQSSHLGDHRIEAVTVEDLHRRHHIANQGIDQSLARRWIIPIARRLARAHVVVVAAKNQMDLGPQIRTPTSISSLRIAQRSWVTVSWVATASYNGVESTTRARTPNTPASAPTALVSLKSRRGRPDARSRLRTPTSTVG